MGVRFGRCLTLYALDEYGVPAEIASKLMQAWGAIENVDQGLQMLASIDLTKINLQPFERALIDNVRGSLPLRARAV